MALLVNNTDTTGYGNLFNGATARKNAQDDLRRRSLAATQSVMDSMNFDTGRVDASLNDPDNTPIVDTYTPRVSGGGGGSAAPAYSAEDLAYIDDQISQLNAQKSRLGTGLQSGLTGLEDNYNKNLSTQNQLRSRALEDFDTQTQDTERNKNAAIGKVDTNARVLADSLRRRLGLASGADSSAYKITAPGAVARDASADRTGVVENFGVNFRNLDTAKKRADTDFETLLRDLSDQKRNSERGLRQGIMEQENSIDGGLADAARQRSALLGGGYTQARAASQGIVNGINNRNSQIDNLFNQYRNPYTVKPVDVQKVSLRDYLVDKSAIQTNKANGTQDPYAPYAPTINKQDDEELV